MYKYYSCETNLYQYIGIDQCNWPTVKSIVSNFWFMALDIERETKWERAKRGTKGLNERETKLIHGIRGTQGLNEREKRDREKREREREREREVFIISNRKSVVKQLVL